KVEASDRTSIETSIETLKETLKGSDIEAITRDTDALMKLFQEVSAKIYSQQAPPEGEPAPQQPDNQGPDVVDADFEVVDDQ
ncbi:MAG: molecular chaperone DnaK, partial [Eubacteriales bacterium]